MPAGYIEDEISNFPAKDWKRKINYSQQKELEAISFSGKIWKAHGNCNQDHYRLLSINKLLLSKILIIPLSLRHRVHMNIVSNLLTDKKWIANVDTLRYKHIFQGKGVGVVQVYPVYHSKPAMQHHRFNMRWYKELSLINVKQELLQTHIKLKNLVIMTPPIPFHTNIALTKFLFFNINI